MASDGADREQLSNALKNYIYQFHSGSHSPGLLNVVTGLSISSNVNVDNCHNWLTTNA